MKYREVFCKDPIGGQFWTMFVESKDETTLTDIFEYVTLRTFGMSIIGVKENCDKWDHYEHNDCVLGLRM